MMEEISGKRQKIPGRVFVHIDEHRK
jgi:hypothetical protein